MSSPFKRSIGGLAVLDTAGGSVWQAVVDVVVPPVGTLAGSVTQNGITFTFDKQYPVGQFVNGDWWATPNVGDAAVTIASISPAFDATVGAQRNGWQVNPNGSATAYDARVSGFNLALVPALPYAAAPDSSVIKAVSLAVGSATGTANVTYINNAVVLTVLASAPPVDAFRPPWRGTFKPILRASALRTNLLASVPDPGSAPSLASVEARFRQVQLDQSNVTNGNFHPQPLQSFFQIGSPSIPHGYGANIAIDNALAIMRLCLNDSIAAKTNLLNYVVQAGIDWYGLAKAGWTIGPDGGHANGRKIMVAFAAYLLNDPDMLSIAGGTFGEQGVFNWFAGAGGASSHFVGTGPGMVIFGRSATTFPYTGAGAKDAWDPNHFIDGSDPVNLTSTSAGGVNGTGYIEIASTHPTNVATICSLMPGLRAVFNYDPIIHYGNRYADFGWWTQPDGASASRPASVTFTTVGSKAFDWSSVYARHGTNANNLSFSNTWTQLMHNTYNVTTFTG